MEKNTTEMDIIETVKFEYDAAVGGNTSVPESILTYGYASEHLKEIKALTDAIDNPVNTKLVFQKLPKHMRRRAMSHNPKRLPRKYRQAHIAQMTKSGAPARTKRPSRKYRRKPKNLLTEYQRRQRANIWLETHIWHAKRFHMINLWGYKLAESSCDKTFRSCYRASSKHCLIQDISYIGCVEINGPLAVLRSGFSRMHDSRIGLGICAKTYVNGKREGTVDLYKADSYPYGALGKINFIWRCEDAIDGKIWFFVHPSIYRDTVNEFVKVFDLVKEETEMGSKRNTNEFKQPKYLNETNGLQLMELKDNLNRFRLTGPLSHAVLISALRPKAFDGNTEKSWFLNYMETEEGKKAHSCQNEYWNSVRNVTSPAELCPNMILALNIEDPRINRPKKRSKALPDILEKSYGNDDALITVPDYNAVSKIWDTDVRKKISDEKMSTHIFCVLRNKHALVPGERCSFEKTLQPVPVLLIQRPGVRNVHHLGYGCGWDVIVPSGYGISTWMSLIMWGARPGALRETETVHREACEDEFLPDTLTAELNDIRIENDLRTKYFKRPPNKRANYIKLKIASPFRCLWMPLIRNWSTDDVTTYYVLREKETLSRITNCCVKRAPLSTLNLPANCLIPVAIEMDNRGAASKFSIICLPKRSDLKRNERKLRAYEYDPVVTETIGADKNEDVRKKLRIEHKKLLKRLRNRRVRVKRKKQETAERKVLIAKPKTAALIAEQLKTISELWLPCNPSNIRHQCSREVIGYLTQCQFSFSKARVAGIGYVTANALKQLLQLFSKISGPIKVLIRDPKEFSYRLASLRIRN